MPAKRPRDRKETILATAAALFAEHGYDAVGIDDIGAAVGVSGPAIYHHFPNKLALLGAIVADTVQRISAGMDPGDENVPPDELVRRLITASLDHQSGMVAMVNEGYRVDVNAIPGMDEILAESTRLGMALVHRINPDLDLPDIAVRTQGVTRGPLAAIAYETPEIPRPALDQRLARSEVAVVAAPRLPREVSPRGTRAWQPRRSRRQQIIDAAVPLIHQHNPYGVSVNDIGEAAGLSGPTVYHYFETKLDITLAAWEQAALRTAVGARDALAAADSATDALDRLARSYAAVALDPISLVAAPFHYRLVPKFREVTPPHQDTVPDAWTGVLAELRPELPDVEVRLLVNMVLPFIAAAAGVVQGQDEWLDEISALAVAYVMA